jgi:hypothetical protein
MDALLTAIVVWLAANFSLPATFEHPKVAFLPPAEIAFLRYQAVTPEKKQEVMALLSARSADPAREVVAVYDDRQNTIYLANGWTGQTPAELSVLVHELVHHLQAKASLKFECLAAREAAAYAAQEAWLGLFRQSLQSEFQIDPFTLKVNTSCGF